MIRPSDPSADPQVACDRCHRRYTTSALEPGSPFACQGCGAILYAEGVRDPALSALDVNLSGWFRLRRPDDHLRLIPLESNLIPGTLATRMFEAGLLDAQTWAEWLREANATPRRLIPEYDLVTCLGRGGMGMVWHGRHHVSNRPVAIKLLTGRFDNPQKDRERFLREARVAVALDHPNIVKGYGPGMLGSMPYYVMEYVHGESTGALLDRYGPFDEAAARDIVRQAARALAYADGRGVVHRDIKPDNLLRARDGAVKLLDYGISARSGEIAAGERDELTGTRRLFGTPAYLAPEQARGEAVDIRADLYALGVTLYHLLTGRTPFRKATTPEMLRAHCRETPPDPREFRPELSAGTVEVIMRLLEKEPGDRYPSPAALLADLGDADPQAGRAPKAPFTRVSPPDQGRNTP